MLKAIRDKLVVLLDEFRGTTQSLLYIPQQAETTPVTGVIVSAGAKAQDWAKPGQRVHCKRYAGLIHYDLTEPKKKFLLISQNDVDCLCDENWYYDFHSFKL